MAGRAGDRAGAANAGLTVIWRDAGHQQALFAHGDRCRYNSAQVCGLLAGLMGGGAHGHHGGRGD